jgi:DNA-binding MarR family transcriptional regulator
MPIASKNRQVVMGIKILRTIYNQNLNANELIQHTSKDKTFAYSVIKQLRREELVASNKIAEHKQKRVQSLTEAGKSLVQLIHGTEKFIVSHTAFRNARLSKLPSRQVKEEKVKVQPGKIVRLRIPIPRPPIDPTRVMNIAIRDAGLLESLSFQYFNDLIFYKCAQFIQLSNSKNYLTRLILQDIIATTTGYYLQEISEVIKHQDRDFTRGFMIGTDQTRIDSIMNLPISIASSLQNPLLRVESNNLLSSVFLILNPSKNEIEKRVNKLQKELEKVPAVPWAERNEQGIAFYNKLLESIQS